MYAQTTPGSATIGYNAVRLLRRHLGTHASELDHVGIAVVSSIVEAAHDISRLFDTSGH
jgi:hypothetical protein